MFEIDVLSQNDALTNILVINEFKTCCSAKIDLYLTALEQAGLFVDPCGT
jgi:hypothetical protein